MYIYTYRHTCGCSLYICLIQVCIYYKYIYIYTQLLGTRGVAPAVGASGQFVHVRLQVCMRQKRPMHVSKET